MWADARRFRVGAQKSALIILHCFALTMLALSLMLAWIFMFASWRKPDLPLIQWPSAHYLAFYFNLAKPLNEFSSIEWLLDISKINKNNPRPVTGKKLSGLSIVHWLNVSLKKNQNIINASFFGVLRFFLLDFYQIMKFHFYHSSTWHVEWQRATSVSLSNWWKKNGRCFDSSSIHYVLGFASGFFTRPFKRNLKR